MENERPVSTGRKIWECVNPLVFLFVCMIACSFVVSFVIMTMGMARHESMMQMTQQVAESTLLVDLIFYGTALVVKGPRVGYEKYRYSHVSMRWPLWKSILTGAAAFFIAMGLNILLDLTGLPERFTDYAEMSGQAFGGQNPFLLVLTVVIIGPIAEEIIFRLMVFGRIRFYFGSKWGILVSSVLFGIYHMNVIQFIFCTLLGIILSWIYDRSGNLWIPIGIHMAINFVGILGYII